MNTFIKGFRKGMKRFGDNIAGIVNAVLLTLVYIFGVGLSVLFVRIAKKKFMELELSKSATTYWKDLDLKKKPLEAYYRQF